MSARSALPNPEPKPQPKPQPNPDPKPDPKPKPKPDPKPKPKPYPYPYPNPNPNPKQVSFLRTRKTPHYLRKLRSASGSTDNHATSGLKFQILHELLSVSSK